MRSKKLGCSLCLNLLGGWGKKSSSATVTKTKTKAKNGFLSTKPYFLFKMSPKHNRIVAALQPL